MNKTQPMPASGLRSARAAPTPAADAGSRYQRFARPGAGRLLRALRMAPPFHRATGDRLYYTGSDGREVEVLDFLGGFGASLFGHNHPSLVRAAQQSFEERRPFNAQLSCRSRAAELAEQLDRMLHARLGRRFVSVVLNTGAEAVEAAIKHAELRRRRRLDEIRRQLDRRASQVRRSLRDGAARFSPDALGAARELLGSAEPLEPEQVASALRRVVEERLQASPRLLALERAFHGKTTGAVALTHNLTLRQPFARLGPRTVFVSPDDPASLAAAIESASPAIPWLDVDGDVVTLGSRAMPGVAALFVEPIQGEGGIRVIPGAFLEHCRDLADRHGFALVFDEIQSGMGRTGTFLYSEQSGVAADYYLLSKSLGGGVAKISALLIERGQYDEEFDVLHSSTFAEDDHSATVACSALSLLENDPGFLERCRTRGKQLRRGLLEIQREFPGVIEEVRGAGLLLGVALASMQPSASATLRWLGCQQLLGPVVCGYLLQRHRLRVGWTLARGDTLRIEPSAFVSAEDCDLLLAALRDVAEILYKANAFALTRYLIGGAEGPEDAIRDYRSAPGPRQATGPSRSIAFVGHFIRAGDARLFDRSLEGYRESELESLIDRFYDLLGPAVTHRTAARSRAGGELGVTFVGLFLDSRLISREMRAGNAGVLAAKVQSAVDVAVEEGCEVVGLGGYSSILTRNCRTVATDAIALTSGNALTIGMGVEALRRGAAELGIALDTATLAVVGAAGNICATYAELLAEQVPQVVLIGRPGSEERLREVAARIYGQSLEALRRAPAGTRPGGVAGRLHDSAAGRRLLAGAGAEGHPGHWLAVELQRELGERAPVRISTRAADVRAANLIVAASNDPEPILLPETLAWGPVVICDLSIPPDVHPRVARERRDVVVLQGGIVRLPLDAEFEIHGIPLEPGLIFACLSETILLGLDGATDHFSFGRVSKQQVKRILQIAERHGFELARPKTEASY